MADKDKVKVIANYGAREDRATLWGVDFVLEGEGDDAVYVAVVDADVAKSLIDANRAIKAK